MSNAIFPGLDMPGIEWDSVRSPLFNTAIQQAVSGVEIRYSEQPYPVWQWTFSFDRLRDDQTVSGYSFPQLQTILGFFLARRGSLDTFLFLDPNDSSVTAQPLGIGDGTTTTFQMGRTYAGASFEPIYNPITGYIVYVDGVAQVLGTDYTFAGGIITFVTAPPNTKVVTWTGTYYWRCRFATDTNDFKEFSNHFWSLQEFSFVSVLGA